MTASTAESWTHIRSRLATTRRLHPDADITDLQRDLKAARLADHIRKTVDAAPELTADQRERLAGLLRGGPDAA